MIADLIATFAALSLLSIGGVNATVPEIHRQVVDLHHWTDDRTFASLVAIAQVAPGPNLLIVSLIGWSLGGVTGMLASTAAMVAPSSLLALGIGRFVLHGRVRDALLPLRRTLAPVAVGLMAASSLVMLRAAYVGAASIGIAVAVTVATAFSRLSPLWGLASGAAVMLTLHHLSAR